MCVCVCIDNHYSLRATVVKICYLKNCSVNAVPVCDN